MKQFLSTHCLGGVVLAGGQSSRMGALTENKALLSVHAGQSLLEQNVLLLQGHCSQVWVSCGDKAPYAGYTCVPDVFPHAGPVGGVHASLQYARKLGLEAVLVLACDMPALQPQILEKLVQARCEALAEYMQKSQSVQQEQTERQGRQEGIAKKAQGRGQENSSSQEVFLKNSPLLTAFYEQEAGRLQTLAAIYEVAALPYFAWALTQNEQKLKISKLIPEERQVRIAYGGGSLADNFINLNTPQDVTAYTTSKK